MGTCYAVVCRPCRKVLDIGKQGRVFSDHVPAPVGNELRMFAIETVMAGAVDPDWPERWTPVMLRWMHEHAGCGPLSIVNDAGWVDDDLLEQMYPDDPAGDWPQKWIGDL